MQGTGALTAEYWLAANGTAAHAEIETGAVAEYIFMETGLLGELIPQQVDNITLANESCSDCRYVQEGEFRIRFSPGNYTLRYDTPVRDNHMRGGFAESYSVFIHLPSGYDVRNPFLGSFTREGRVSVEGEGTVAVAWDQVRYWDVRFYDRTQETVLVLFGTIWGTIALLLLVPYLLLERRRRR